MSTIKSSAENLTLNADGSGNDIKFQSNGVEKASISDAGLFTSTTIDATKLTGNLPAISGASLTGIDAGATVASSAPGSPSAGDMWFDTTAGTNAMKVYNGTNWDQMSNKFSASGGTTSLYGSYKVHTFTSSGTFTAEASGDVDYLIIAGGGGGGGGADSTWHGGGGGGAGGMLSAAAFSVTAQDYTITIGAGGSGGTGANNPGNIGTSGANTTALGFTAIGGGSGGAGLNTAANGKLARDGGSGGGDGGGGTANQGASGTSGQGNDGGDQANMGGEGGDPYGAGGGGKGAVGGNVIINAPGIGGAGATNAYRTGSNVTYAGGGGGGNATDGTNYGTASGSGAGGAGGGGDGGGHGANSVASARSVGQNATANTGGGGGGGSGGTPQYNGGSGGSGIVVIRYAV